MKTPIILTLTVLLIAASCSTMNNRQVAEAASVMSASLIGGDVDALTGSSGTPFLFETEVLPAPVQLSALWDALAVSGYDFSPRGEIMVFDPDLDTPLLFSSSREIRVWFERHAPEKAALVAVPTTDGRLIVVIDRNRRSSARIRGLKVEP